MMLYLHQTSSPNERIFSLASRLISARRARLDPDLEIICAGKNLEWYESLEELVICDINSINHQPY